MNLDQKYNEKQQKIRNEAAQLAKTHPIEELEKRFFKNFGCLNFVPDDVQHEFDLANEFHRQHMETFPEQHSVSRHVQGRGYEATKCKCGFEWACDSSD